ncbi:MAG: tRNA dihydrouridine synthase DusB, partial [bacterium]
GWYVRDLPGGEVFRQNMNRIELIEAQLDALNTFFEMQLAYGERLQYATSAPALAA